ACHNCQRQTASEPTPMTNDPTITLDQLVALNDEIAALVRAGLPLERGLREVGGDLPGRLGTTMTALAGRLSRGASLPEAIEAERARLPRIYRAIVEAG